MLLYAVNNVMIIYLLGAAICLNHKTLHIVVNFIYLLSAVVVYTFNANIYINSLGYTQMYNNVCILFFIVKVKIWQPLLLKYTCVNRKFMKMTQLYFTFDPTHCTYVLKKKKKQKKKEINREAETTLISIKWRKINNFTLITNKINVTFYSVSFEYFFF